MTKDIIGKLTNEIETGITTEVQVVYVLAGVRKIIERDGVGETFSTLRFHCDWALHALMDRKPARQVIQRFDDALDLLAQNVELQDLPDDLRGELEQVSSMRLFRKQLRTFCEQYGLPWLNAGGADGWTKFLHLYTKVIEDIPLVAKADARADAQQRHVTRVVVNCETAPRLREDQYGRRHQMFKVTWNVFDSTGQSGEVFALNSFKVGEGGE